MAKQQVSTDEIYQLVRDALGREPDSPENKYNYLQLAQRGASRADILRRIREDSPVDSQKHQEFLRSLGFDKSQEEIGQEQLASMMSGFMADMIDDFVATEEKRLEDIGVFDPDGKIRAQIRKDVLEDEGIKKYMQEQYDIFNRQVKGGRIKTMQDYDSAIQQIQDITASKLKDISITEAETQEKLKSRLVDLGATTQYNLNQARLQWEQTARREEQQQLESGRGFSGVMKRQMGEIGQAKGAELGEIARRGAVAQQQEQRIAKYTLERARAAREAISAYKQREMGIAKQGLIAGQRKYGLSGEQRERYELAPVSGGGYFESEQQARLKRLGGDIRAREIEQRLRMRRQEFQQARDSGTYRQLL